MSDFASGFASGASVGDRIQQRLLAKELRKIEDTRYDDELNYRRGRDRVADQRYAEDRLYGRMRDAIGDNRYAEERRYGRGRDAVADARDARNYTAQRGDVITRDLRETLDAVARRKQLAAEVNRLNAQADYYRAGGAQGASGSGGTAEYGPDGELLKVRQRLAPGQMPPMGGGQALSPEDQALATAIEQKQAEIGKHRVAMAQGDNRTGFLDMFSRQGEIDDAMRAIEALRGQQGGTAQPQTTQPGGLSPQDQQALQWAKANRNDPRAAAILQRLGAQ